MNNTAESNVSNTVPLQGVQKMGVLLMGIFLVILSGGRFVTPAAAFLAPLFLLRFTRNTSARTGLSILFVLLFLSLMVRLHDYFAVARPLSLLFIAGFALLEVLPFLVDRKLYKKLPRFLRPFVLPCVYVALGFAVTSFFPFGSMGERAYSQVGNSELMQLLSTTGVYGLTFVIFWFAAVMAAFWDAGFVWRRCRSQVLPLSLVLMIVFVSGGFRNIFEDNDSPTVRIAGVVSDQIALMDNLQSAGVDGGLAALAADGYTKSDVQEILTQHHDELFEMSATQAGAGAAIVVWAEADGVVLQANEEALIQRASQVAQGNSIYLVAALAVVAEQVSDEQAPVENKLVILGPTGEQLGQHTKARLLWNQPYKSSDQKAPLVLDTPYGKLAFAIGFDLDFPADIRHARDADIIIAPSSDWRTLSPHHSLMATFRGVENGASVFRPTSDGVSIASDSHGRILARTDHFTTTAHTLIADVPTGGVDTFYSVAGDWFAWAAIGLLAAMLIAATVASKRERDRLDLEEVDRSQVAGARDRSRITAIQWREAERDNNLQDDI